MSNKQTPATDAPITPAAFRSSADARERIENLAPASDATDTGRVQNVRGEHVRTKVMWIGLAVLLSAAAFVFLFLPEAVQPPTVTTQPGDRSIQPGDAVTATGSPAPAAQPITELAPWQTAQILRQKEAAEALTESFVRLQMELEDAQVTRWGGSRFEQAIALAQKGDEQFSQREFVAAAESYEEGLALLLALQQDAGNILAQTLSRGRQALENYDAVAAKEAFELALAMEPGNPEAITGMARAQRNERVAELAKLAVENENQGNLEAAMTALGEARKLDPDDQVIATEAARLGRLLRDRQFDSLMSLAYSELDGGHVDGAVRAFEKAAQLRPGSNEVKEGLSQAESLRRLNRISDLQARASALEAAENWAEAADLYTQALGLDSTLVFARDGLQRTSERNELDKRLRGYIQAPERLQSDAVYGAARQTLQFASQVEPRTPILGSQISELEKVLERSRQAVSVFIESDNETLVTLGKVGPLGTFTEKTLSLRPGSYVATGKRNGYRDVRVPFVVAAGESRLSIKVSCEESI
jgi:cytochrome c-type biogenesis protein CcmH/NrfG